MTILSNKANVQKSQTKPISSSGHCEARGSRDPNFSCRAFGTVNAFSYGLFTRQAVQAVGETREFDS